MQFMLLVLLWLVFFSTLSLSSFYWSAIASCIDNAFASQSCELKFKEKITTTADSMPVRLANRCIGDRIRYAISDNQTIVTSTDKPLIGIVLYFCARSRTHRLRAKGETEKK